MYEIRPGQSVELLKELHILTREGKLNQDSQRKLKQIYHLFNFIEPLLKPYESNDICLVDHGAGKSYLGFILFDLYFKSRTHIQDKIIGIESRSELVKKSQDLATKLNFQKMEFIESDIASSIGSNNIPAKIHITTALHACDTATDDAIDFGLRHNTEAFVLVPCCQAEVASFLRQNKKFNLSSDLLELYRHPLHTREFGSQLTNVLRCLRLQSHGYEVTVTEFVGFEHSMKNELILAKKSGKKNEKAQEKIAGLLSQFKIKELTSRFI